VGIMKRSMRYRKRLALYRISTIQGFSKECEDIEQLIESMFESKKLCVYMALLMREVLDYWFKLTTNANMMGILPHTDWSKYSHKE